MQGAGFRVQGAGFRVRDSRCWVQGAGLRVIDMQLLSREGGDWDDLDQELGEYGTYKTAKARCWP